MFPVSLSIIRRGSIDPNKAYGWLPDDFHRLSTEHKILRYVQPLFQASVSQSRVLWVQEKHKTYEFMKDSLIQSDRCGFPFFCYFFIQLLIFQPTVKTRDVDKCYRQSVMRKLAAFLSKTACQVWDSTRYNGDRSVQQSSQFSLDNILIFMSGPKTRPLMLTTLSGGKL